MRLSCNQTLVTVSGFHNQDLFQCANERFHGWRCLVLWTPEAFNPSGPSGVIGVVSTQLLAWVRHTAC